jgi:hypothetical protein
MPLELSASLRRDWMLKKIQQCQYNGSMETTPGRLGFYFGGYVCSFKEV